MRNTKFFKSKSDKQENRSRFFLFSDFFLKWNISSCSGQFLGFEFPQKSERFLVVSWYHNRKMHQFEIRLNRFRTFTELIKFRGKNISKQYWHIVEH